MVRSLALLLSGAALAVAASGSVQAARVKVDAALSQSVVRAQSSDAVYLRLSLTALADTVAERDRPPVNVALVIDRSGSMQGDRLAHAKAGARAALERLGSDDVVSLVEYNHKVRVLVPSTRLGSSRRKFERAIGRLRASGTTALYAGVREGGDQVLDALTDMQVNRVILLSDGLANVGPSKPSDLKRLGRRLAAQGITVSTIGLGLQYNEDLMQGLAAASDGNHVFVERPSDLAEIFDRELGDALSIAAKDVTITIECRAGFVPKRVLGREASISGQKITLKLAQLQADNERYVLVELAPPKSVRDGTTDVAHVDVGYLDLGSGRRSDVTAEVQVEFSRDADVARKSVDKSVMVQVTEQVATENTEKAVEMRDKGDLDGAKQALEKNAAYLNRQKQQLGTGAAAASKKLIDGLNDLEEESRKAAKNLTARDWARTRKSMRRSQHKSKVQQAY